jgi:hypothetical protein
MPLGACDSSNGSQPIDTDTINHTDTYSCEGKPDSPSCPADALVNDTTEIDTTTYDYCEPFAVIAGDWYNVKDGQLATVTYKQIPPRVCEVDIEGPGAELGGILTDVYELPLVAEDDEQITRIEMGLADNGRLYQRWYDDGFLGQEYYYSRNPPAETAQ